MFSKGSISFKPPLIQIMAGLQTGNKPLSDPSMASFTNAYMCHSVSTS